MHLSAGRDERMLATLEYADCSGCQGRAVLVVEDAVGDGRWSRFDLFSLVTRRVVFKEAAQSGDLA
jgi:hypothetical protein